MKRFYNTIFKVLCIFAMCLFFFINAACKEDIVIENPTNPINKSVFYIGADLSYVNEMEDCGAIYKDSTGTPKDPFEIFRDAGCNLIRVRLWYNPDSWTKYSNLADVEKTIRRAKDKGMKVLLNFHYSDTWADPGKQIIPSAWRIQLNNTSALVDSMYNYTYRVLDELNAKNLTPDMVQVGNETNVMILQEKEGDVGMNWTRNASLINSGIKAVRDFSKKANKPVEIMLHIAKPEDALWWFLDATANNITDYDWIGISYYTPYSRFDLEGLSKTIGALISIYKKRVLIAEAAYPFTLEDADSMSNILFKDALQPGYSATQEGQFAFLNALTKSVVNAGGEGVIYWEPAWLSTPCSTLYGTGSAWDNATLFDKAGIPTQGMKFFNKTK